ncbi:Hypothetical predicted protein [Paramuricea clavata]|uniref:Uncharacterized protein n=1 Tax=Paramuricea clavata TaxID=317549 RepID=A0A6S7G2T4_PARCT|nr:Hypothetical predicted protein [Paramuricea clavata]
MFNISKHDWANSHGPFKELVGMGTEQLWVEKCNIHLAELAKIVSDATCTVTTTIENGQDDERISGTVDRTDTVVDTELTEAASSREKRKATEELIEQLTVPSKRNCNENKPKDDFQAHVENCRIDNNSAISHSKCKALT